MTDPGKSETAVAHDIVQLLRGDESREHSAANVLVAERVFEALRVRLSSVLGPSGYATLLARALALTRPGFPWLGEIKADRTGSLTGYLSVADEATAMESARGYAALLTRFTDLLETFIGADLTSRLMNAVWQDLENNPTENDAAAESGRNYNL